MPVELRHLQYFRALAEKMNFGRAATAAHISQSSMSEQIQRLEDVIGVALVDRHGRAIRLTPAGEVLRDEAEAVLTEVAAMVERVRRAGGLHRGLLRVGYSEMAIGTAMSGILHALRQGEPLLQVELHEQSSIGADQALLTGRLDVAFVPWWRAPPGIAIVELGAQPLLLAAASGSALAIAPAVRLADVEAQPLILPEDASTLTRHVLGAFARSGLMPAIGTRANRALSMLTLVASGQGVAFLPGSLRALVPPGVVLRPLDPPLTIPFGMLRATASDNPAVAAAAIIAARAGQASDNPTLTLPRVALE